MTSGPAADAFTLQVIQGSMTSTVREMMRTTKASAHSTVFAEGEDFTCAIADPRGRLTFQAEGLGLHAATFPAAIELVLAQYDSFRPGDVFFHNDPYGGGAHQADGAFARPVFHGDELVAWVANRGHWSDVGGMSAGGWAGSATHVLQEALFVPPVRLVKAGELDDELARLVLANVRNADDAWGTIQSQLASLETAAARICSTVDRYGLDAFRAATDAYLEYTRKRFLVGLRALPDGEWSAEDFLDDDGAGAGPLRIALTVRKDGERISVDFDGTDRQARGPANTSFVNTRSAVLVVMLSLVDPDLPLNSGWFDLVEISAPRGTLVNPVYPAPMFHGTGAPMPRVFDLVLRALAQAVPDRVTAASYGTGTVVVVAFVDEETGDERSWMHYTGGGGGARATSDGLDGVWWTLANCKLESIELVEQRFPLLFEGEGWQRPSAGPGPAARRARDRAPARAARRRARDGPERPAQDRALGALRRRRRRPVHAACSERRPRGPVRRAVRRRQPVQVRERPAPPRRPPRARERRGRRLRPAVRARSGRGSPRRPRGSRERRRGRAVVRRRRLGRPARARRGGDGAAPRRSGMKRLGIDVGGTFTDLVLHDGESGELRRAKVLTVPERPEEGVLAALASLGLEAGAVDLFMHGTTLVTNLVLLRAGAAVGLLTTAGFEDLLDLQLTYRDEPYNLQWQRPEPLVPGALRLGVTERVDARGEVLVPLDEAGLAAALRRLLELGAESLAVCFLHAYANGEHERRARALIEELAPGVPVSLSSEVDPQIREYQRLSTTVLNAYAKPRVAAYVDELVERTGLRDELLFMHSGGGVLPAAAARELPISLVRSGPAGGVLGAAFVGEQLGYGDLVCLDLGGTSCDVSIVTAGEPGRSDTVWVDWMIPARVQAIDITSIGAGGGSIAWVDSGDRLRIGPRSAGARPGPACYGRGGTEATTTDANLALGILDPDYFLGGSFAVDPDAALAALDRLGRRLDLDALEVARGVHLLVDASMAQAVRELTVERGLDPRGYTLVSYGGAGGQHAAHVAAELEIRRVVFPSYASVLSSFGLVAADLSYAVSRSLVGRIETIDLARLIDAYGALEERALAALPSANGGVGTRWLADMRYTGQLHELRVELARDGLALDGAREAFEDRHEREFGSRAAGAVEVVNLHVVATRPLPRPRLAAGTAPPAGAGPERTRMVALTGERFGVRRREALAPGDAIPPCTLVEDVDSTILVPAGWAGRVAEYGHIVIERAA